MKKNMSSIDRMIRILILVVVAALYFTNVISGTLAIVMGAVGIILATTGVINFCPIYSIFGISTCPVPEKK